MDLGSARCTLSNVEFLELCDTLSNVELQSGVEDSHIWKLSSSGQYTAKLTYRGLFQGSVRLFSWEGIWKTWAPAKCRFFMWLVVHNRCWTADRLARRGLDHRSRRLLCDQDAETINRLLVDCFCTRFLVWPAAEGWHAKHLAPDR